MKIILTEDLKDYMIQEGRKNIIVEVKNCVTWGGVSRTISAGLVDDDIHVDERYFMTEQTELGKIYLPKSGVRYGSEVKLSFMKLLWMKRIFIDGIY